MSPLRLKVEVGKDAENYTYKEKNPLRKFIFIIDSPSTKTIDELIRTLQEYIIQKFSYINLQIVQLMTVDGFILAKSDLCSNVFKDNDHIICIDMKRFIGTYSQKFKEDQVWLELSRHDASDDQEKFIQIGLNNVSELFIRMHGTSYVTGLYLFGIYELITIANEKRQNNLIARLDNTNNLDLTSTADWFLETKWEYDTVSNKDLFIICNLKVGSSDEIYSTRLHILLDHTRMRIQRGEITNLSSEVNDGTTLTDQQRQRLKELTAKLPPLKRTGPELNTSITQNLKLTKYECEGESSIRMSYGSTNTVTIYQGLDSSTDGNFSQHFVITHIIFSKKATILPEILNQKRTAPVERPVSVANLTVFYQTHDGAWRESHDVIIAPVTTRNEEPKWLTDSVINIEPDKLISFSIRGAIVNKGEPGRDNQARNRSHKSLPQPLKLKIVITDNMGKQSSLIVEQLNKPLYLETRESFLKDNQSSINELLAFVYTDHYETEERIYMVMYLDKDNALVIRNPNRYSTIYERKRLRTLDYNAKRDKQTELIIGDMHYEYNSNESNASFLFDPETYMAYAVRLEVSTKTSKAEETVPIPIEKIK